MIIKVTQSHIDKGVKWDCCLCPVALAIIENHYPECYVVVGASDICISCFEKKDYKRFFTTKKLKQFIYDFDKGKLVKPTTFYY